MLGTMTRGNGGQTGMAAMIPPGGAGTITNNTQENQMGWGYKQGKIRQPIRKRSRKKTLSREKRKMNLNMNRQLIVFPCNIRGFNSKKESRQFPIKGILDPP